MKTPKQTLRSKLKNLRQDFVIQRKNCQSMFDSRATCLDSTLASSSVVGGYCAIGSEVSPADILRRARSLGKAVALPYLGGRNEGMTFKLWPPDQPLEKAPFGFAQPAASATDVAPDLVLVPLVGFDRQMNRLGQGAGHYDQYFSNDYRSLKIGIAWSCQEVEAVPTDDWDVRLDAILTEKDWIVDANSVIAS